MRQLKISKKTTRRNESLDIFLDDIKKYKKLDTTQEVALSKIIHWELLSPDEADSLRRLIDWKCHRDTFVTKREELSSTLNWNIWDSKNDLKKRKWKDLLIKWEDLWITKQQARDWLVNCNLRFVVSVAKQYQNRKWASLPDLINEWNIWLIKATPRFDHTRWFKFISYAVWRIRQSILRSLSQNTTIKHSQAKTPLMSKIWRFEEMILQKEMRLPTKDEIKEALDITDDQYNDYLKAYFTSETWSLDAYLGPDDDRTLYDKLHSEDSQTDQNITEVELKETMMKALEQLNRRQFDVLSLSSWLNPKWIEYTNAEIASMLNISKDAARQALNRGRENLAKKLGINLQNGKRYISTESPDDSIDLEDWKDKMRQAIDQLMNQTKKQKFTQCKVFCMYSWIKYTWLNDQWRPYSIVEIAEELGRTPDSVRHSLDHVKFKIASKFWTDSKEIGKILKLLRDSYAENVFPDISDIIG